MIGAKPSFIKDWLKGHIATLNMLDDVRYLEDMGLNPRSKILF